MNKNGPGEKFSFFTPDDFWPGPASGIDWPRLSILERTGGDVNLFVVL